MLQKPRQISATHSLTVRYVLALGTVALLSVLGQYFVQAALKRQASDTHVVNIAGRQRMLSQRLVKAALAVEVVSDPASRRERIAELAAVTALWEHSQRGLQCGDAALELTGDNSRPVRALFAGIEPPHQRMLAASKALLARLAAGGGAAPRGDLSALIGALLIEEGPFLAGMDAIVTQYDREAKARVLRLKRAEPGPAGPDPADPGAGRRTGLPALCPGDPRVRARADMLQ